MKDTMVYLVVVIVTTILVVVFTRWVYEAVMGSNMPEWLKYLILR